MDILEKDIYGPSVPMIVETLRVFGALPGDARKYSILDIHDLLHKGLPWGFVFKIKLRSKLEDKDIAVFLGVSTTTLRRARQKLRKRMSRNVSEHAVRLGVVILAAYDLFDDDQIGAIEWLKCPAYSLAGRVPLDIAATSIGANEVLNIMVRIADGIPP